MTLRIGVITIGQAPRADMARAFAPLVDGNDIEIIQRGALDGLTEAEITTDFAPHEDSATYVSKLLNGRSVEIAKSSIIDRMQAHVDELSSTCEAIVIVCTGDFPMLTSDSPIFFPDHLLVEAVRHCGIDETLGLIVPLLGQETTMAEKWQPLGVPIAFASASPYFDSDVEGAAISLVQRGARTIVLDCIGYTAEHAARAKKSIGRLTDIPVFVPQDLVPQMVAAKLDLSRKE